MRMVVRCRIEQIAVWYPDLFLDMHIAACVACLPRGTAQPALFDVQCEGLGPTSLIQSGNFELLLQWSTSTEDKARRLRFTVQTRPIVEMGAVAVGLVLAHEMLGLTGIDVTSYGDRADYRSLGPPCVLEFSGTEVRGQLDRRHKQKVKQALSNPFGLPAYVAVCWFSRPRSRVKLSYHQPEI